MPIQLSRSHDPSEYSTCPEASRHLGRQLVVRTDHFSTIHIRYSPCNAGEYRRFVWHNDGGFRMKQIQKGIPAIWLIINVSRIIVKTIDHSFSLMALSAIEFLPRLILARFRGAVFGDT